MEVKIKRPELKCMEPANYRKYFRVLCWSGTRRTDKKQQKKYNKKDKFKRWRSSNALVVCYAPALLGNPSQFAVYATVRRSILARCRQIQASAIDISEDSENDELPAVSSVTKLSKITGIGLRTVFALISQARLTDPQFCEQSLKALLDVLQGHAPEELSHEPSEIISNLHAMLMEVSCGSQTLRVDIPSNLTALSSSCLLALSVARGEAELILNAVASLIMSSTSLADQYVQIPMNLTVLQRSVQAVVLGAPARNLWLNFGVPDKSLFTQYRVQLPDQLLAGPNELVVRSLVSDGCFLYLFTSKGLLKIGSGYGSSMRQEVYAYKSDFFASDRHGWLGYCKDKMYVRIGRKKTEVYEVDKDSLEVRCVIRLDPGLPAPIEPKSAVFSDGNQLGLILLTNFDNLTIKMYDVESYPAERSEGGTHTLSSRREINVHLLRRRTLVLGRAPFEDNLSRRMMDLDTPVAMQLDDNEDDPLLGISAGQDFGLLTTSTGKVYYTGKGTSLGYKVLSPQTGKWTLMKETLFFKNEAPNTRKHKVIQVAVGHEGVHAILVLENGSALFTGIARRGEDGDANRHRRSPKPTRPKKIVKADGHHVVYAACNYGSTALVTRQGQLLMFGKDTQHCDSTGLIAGIRHERVTQVALGKAHAVALTSHGQVYTFGINNKGQCGREFGYTKEKPYSRRHSEREEVRTCVGPHTWAIDYCRVCVLCRECTGFSSACHCASLPNRIPGENCGCGEGDSGCIVCGVCRRCGEASTSSAGLERPELDDDASAADNTSDKENARYTLFEAHSSTTDMDREGSSKVSCLPPARVAVPGGHRVVAIACGLHHTVLLTEHGEVLTFGSNQYGALGAGDIAAHHRIVRVRVPRASAIAAGSNHTAILTKEGELYTFGSYQKGSLGRPRSDEPRTDRSPIWYATPGRVPRLGPRYTCKAVWVSASGDQTFVQVSQSLIKTDTLFSSTITANSKSIVILPNRPEHTFKCITINRNDGSCNAWTGPEQVNFVNTLACLDPLYDVLWCYKPKVQMLECFNILAFDSHKLQRCCSNDLEAFSDTENEYPSYGCMKRLEDFRHLENFEWVNNRDDGVSDIPQRTLSVLKKDLAIPCIPGCSVTRIHAALHLLGCLDSLAYAHDNKLSQVDCKRDYNVLPAAPPKDEFLTVNRFEGNGGGWGYSGHSIEAIRFMCDSDILIGGYGLFGGRGDYSAKIKLFDIGMDGGDLEIDGELVGESDDFVFECAPKDKFPILFDNPLPVMSCRWYVAWACINGPSSDCGSAGQAMVINDDIGFHFKTSKRSNNGTDVNAGQIPCLLYKIATDDLVAPIRHLDPGEPVIALTKNISRKITLSCFCSLITLSQWSWKRFKIILLDTNGQVPTSHQKLTVMKWQKRLVYIIRLCLRLIKSYINEVFPENSKKKKSHDYMCYFEAIADIRNFLQEVLSFQTPNCNMLPRRRRSGYPVCYVQFALDLTKSILVEANETIVACFYAFFPTPVLKWSHLCFLLHHVKDGVVPASHIRELASTCAALCFSQSLRDVLQYIVPVTQSKISVIDCRRPESKVIKEVPCRSATVPRASHSQKPPPIPPRANNRDVQRIQDTGDSSSYLVWHLLDVVPKLLDVVLIPIKKQIMMHPCEDLHEHGETEQQERVVDFSCKLVARLVAEMSFNAVHIREDSESKNLKHLITPSRFMRVNLTRSWNTGNGSPDAICFTVDRPGVVLVGACIYGGVGSYEYTLELLHDLRSTAEEMNPPHSWISVEAVRGTFTSADCQHDMMQIKFEQPVILKENLRYAFRLCNQGGRTTNGDCGLPSVKGPDGTTFNFSSCSLSFNGTTLARGQLPCIIYYSAKEQVVGSKLLIQATETADSLVIALREVTLRVAALIVDRSVELFCALRSEITTEDLRNYGFILQQSPVINTLLPHVLANLEGLDDSKSVVQLLEMVRKLLPQVAAMNLLMPTSDAPDPNITATSQYYTWVESEHPYKQATVSNMRVLFPPQVCWVVLEMDPRSITAQSEDSLTIYAVAGAPKHRCHCSSESADSDPPFRKRLIQLTSETGEAEELDEPAPDAPCMQYNCTYVSVTPKLSNVHADWPRKALLVPGNEVIFSLETASDYLSEYSKSVNDENRYGYRCLCIGYERAPTSTSVEGLLALEMELVHMGAACASRLLAPDLDIPPLTFATILEVQALAMSMGAASSNGEEGASAAREMDGGDESESLLLTRGLHLSSPPTVQHVLEGLPLLRCISTERQFLADFVAGAESTAGGRLARWLAPAPRVEPAKCEMRPPPTPVRPATLLSLPIIIRDQYGDIVASPALKVEMVVQRQEDGNSKLGQTSSTECQGILPDVPYQPSLRDTMCFHAITMMKAYQNYSFEELRLYSGLWGEARAGAAGSGRVPVERVAVHAHADGTYVANWLPIVAGTYIFRCILDDQPTPQELVVVVMESNEEEPVERLQSSQASAAPANVMRFAASCSAGLRVRASTSLQAEEIGCVPPGAYISFVDELINKDGTWLRLSTESVQAYAEGSAGVAWCLMFHRHLKKPLLLPVDYDDSPQEDDAGSLSTYNEAKADVSLWPQDDDADASNDMSADDRRFPFSIQCDLANESDSSPSPFNQYAEPSKRGRFIRDESNPARRLPRRSNGNRDEWSPVKHRPGDNVQDANVLETEIIESEVESRASRLAQTGTQTSPEGETAVGAQLSVDLNKEEDSSPKRAVRDRVSRPKCMSTSSSTPPPLPARANPPSYTPKKHALSPAQGECVRGIFAALLWHEGIVHDAIACAAFLKFHPQLPKAGARVVTRPSAHDVPLPRHQRHSVEVSNAGQYLHIHASTLETLTRSGNEASSSRARKTDINVSIREEDSSHTSETATTPSVVNVLPPALRALVALWDALYDADQLVVATDKLKKEPMENNENEDTRPVSGIRKKKDSKYSKTPYSVRCELCGSASVPPPLAAHMRHMHPGCRAPTAHGYDRAGAYKLADPSPSASNAPTSVCGQLAQDLIGVKIRATLAAYQLWYIYCENCREKAMKASTSTTTKQKTVTMTEAYERVERVEPDVDHLTMRDNAVFLLDLAPLTTTESINASPWHEVAGRSPPSPPGSVWQPAPSFQSLPAFGAGPKTHAPDTARYHSLGRQLPSTSKGGTYAQTNTVGVQFPRVHRSISMGQASERDLAHAARPQRMRFEPDTYDTLSGAGATLLTQPSAALQKLVGCGDWTSESCSVSAFEPPTIDTDSLMRSPVLSFILAKRDLPAYRQKMDAAVRINTVRQYAFEALNWLLRSTTLPTSVHDVMWWFCNALDKYARLAPPVPSFEDNKENEASRAAVPTASVSAICPGGRSARGARAAFHAFLGSVSALAPSLPPASAISLQAVRCWALHYSQHDRAFLHRSQVFSVISKILSHAEDGVYDEGLLGALRESFHSYANKQNFVWSCPDVTGWCDVSVSSRPGMAGALTDGSTETFWESGDDDRNKAKWVEVSYPSGSQDDRPQVVCVHIDNTRDTAAKTALLSFLFSGGTSEMFHMTDLEVDPKTATWVCYTLPRTTSASLRVRCELHGPDPTSRVRQVQVLGAPVAVLDAPQQAHALHSLAERDTLRVFRLLTSQVFGKLLEWEQGGSESGDGAAAEEAAGDDSDLREHVVGILFAGHKLTSLQRQVMSHIVCAIGCEAARVRDDWETALLCAEAEKARAVEDTPPRPTHQQDNYCFEMLSLLLALSGSVVGRAQLAQRTELLIDLMTLLHTGSERVQRQVISLLRRMIAEIPPQKMTAALNYGSDESTRLTLLDHLVSYLGKAITVQVKVKGAGSASPGNVTLGSSVTPTPPAAWFMRGETTKKHSHLVAKMITDMAEDKVSLEWGAETRNAIAQYVSAVAQVEEAERRPPRCVSSPTVWLALSALCVCEPEYAEAIIGASESRENRREGAEASVHCVNHDDGSTLAVIECRTCGFLCAECDRFLHLNRAARTHYRQVCKEEESAIRIDIHEGCGRAKLFWLLLLVDRRTLKALVEFRGMDSGACETGEITTCVASSLTGICRFCGTRGNSGLLAIGNVCADNQCQEHGRDACARVLGCGHLCGGVRGERTCLPCLFGCAAPDSLRQDADDMCMICFTDPLQAAPAIQLSCGHVFHLHCCKKVLANKWIGPRITFSFSQCPICKEDMTHWTLEDLLAPIRQLGEEVKRKALMRLEYEGMGSSNRARSTMDLATYAMERYAYYVCHKCGKAYFGGLARCEAESNGSWEPAELVCGACSDVAGARICPKHGADFLEYKCRYCCSVAVFFCFGTSHFCNACHDDFQRVTNIPRHLLPQCPAGPKGEQLPGSSEMCPLHVQHPSTGEEFALGCGVCRHHSHAF